MTHSIPSLKLCLNTDCGQIATGYTGFCYRCDCGRSLRNYSSAPKPRANVKNPMGVEIECFNNDDVRKVTHVAQFVCRDGSLPSNGGEIKLCSPESRIEDLASDTVQRSLMVGNKVNKQCGLHVHMKINKIAKERELTRSRYFVSTETAKAIYDVFRPMQEYFFDIMPESRKNNRYCKKLSSLESLCSHYSWISISEKYPTIEIRLHPGTMNPWKVKGWVNVCKQLRLHFDNYVNNTEPSNVLNVKDILDQNSIGYKYLQARENGKGVLKSFGFEQKNKSNNHDVWMLTPEDLEYETFSCISDIVYINDPNIYANSTHDEVRGVLERKGYFSRRDTYYVYLDTDNKLYLLNYSVTYKNSTDVTQRPMPTGSRNRLCVRDGAIFVYRPLLGGWIELQNKRIVRIAPVINVLNN